MRAADVMVHDVITVKPTDDVTVAVKLLAEHDISALPVVDHDHKVVGMISEADLIEREEIGTQRRRPWWLEAVTPSWALARDFVKSHGQRVSEIMSSHVIAASEDTPLREVAALLEKHRIKRVPILHDGKLVGMVSRSNLIQALATAEALPHETVSSDRVIRLEIVDRLKHQAWTDFDSGNVIVKDGIVHLWGLVGTPDEHKALLALAEGVPGVGKVSDETIPAY